MDHNVNRIFPAYLDKFYVIILLACVIFGSFAGGIVTLVDQWLTSEEYGHGLLMPFVSGYIIWSKRSQILSQPLQENILGHILILAALLLNIVATLADLESIKHYSFVMALTGLTLSVGSWRLLKICFVPLLLIGLVVPLPYLLISTLTSNLQLISSELGTYFIRLMNIPVFLEGNIIDLGAFKLQVVEACSGLRYLYPLLSISLILVYFLETSFWKKSVVLLSVVPITIIMNSARIAVTGLLVKLYGSGVAEGFLHDFEGWVVFMAAFILLLIVIRLITLGSSKKTPLANLFEFDNEDTDNKIWAGISGYSISLLSTAVICVFLFIATSYVALNSSFTIVERNTFNSFPMRVDGKNVSVSRLEPEVLRVLKADDYFIGAYGPKESEKIGLYMVYYQQQKDGSALHSPRVCLPSGGWEIIDESLISLPIIIGTTNQVNRVIIKKGELTQIVYYWIQQQNNIFANEYTARLSLLRSSLTHNRSDGALVRVNTPVINENYEQADKNLRSFTRRLSAILPSYLPH